MKQQENNQNELVIINEESIKDLIYEIRGQKVMLDFDLARIYGYETKNFNRQVKNNIEKFPEDFRFQISKEELFSIVKCKKFTSRNNFFSGQNGGTRKLPYAFTEQGIYMLMTVLKGELATKQSLALIRLFKTMKDYIVEGGLIMNSNQYLESRFASYDTRFEKIENKLDIVMDNFIDPSTYKHFLIFDGERIEADMAYQTIYSLAKQSLIIIDDYISVKTLELLKVCDKDIQIIICSDNVSRNGVSETFIEDFINDTSMNITLKPTKNKVHDRYIVIDYKTDNETIYHSGSSSKDSGNKITTIEKVEYPMYYHPLIELLLGN